MKGMLIKCNLKLMYLMINKQMYGESRKVVEVVHGLEKLLLIICSMHCES